jgi:hypothetical protein
MDIIQVVHVPREMGTSEATQPGSRDSDSPPRLLNRMDEAMDIHAPLLEIASVQSGLQSPCLRRWLSVRSKLSDDSMRVLSCGRLFLPGKLTKGYAGSFVDSRAICPQTA